MYDERLLFFFAEFDVAWLDSYFLMYPVMEFDSNASLAPGVSSCCVIICFCSVS